MDDNADHRSSLFDGIEMGIGTWSWGDRLIWNYGSDYDYGDIHQAFRSAVDFGFRFFDTAEIYGQGRSEEYLGEFASEVDVPLIIATKFMPYPWRLGSKALKKGLKASLKRLGMEKISLYQMHEAFPPVKIDVWMAQMAEVVQEGLVETVGVSNYDVNQTLEAQNALLRQGLRLTSTQMEYNLLDRRVEENGILELCKEQGITLIAWSPLAMGVLTGKYDCEHPLKGFRGTKYSVATIEKVKPLISMLKKIGIEHEGKSPAQVALNWVICKGAVPIPGEKTSRQLEENTGALGWRLSADEVGILDETSDRVRKS